jgi:hypothetical protein
MPTYTGRYTLEFECTVDAPDVFAASEELERYIGSKDQSGKILSVARDALHADHVCEVGKPRLSHKMDDLKSLAIRAFAHRHWERTHGKKPRRPTKRSAKPTSVGARHPAWPQSRTKGTKLNKPGR